MKLCLIVASAWILSLAGVRAQIAVEIVLEQEQFLRDERVPVKVRISNRSGQTLRFGQEPDWIAFTVESRDGAVVKKLDDVRAPGEFTLESSMVGTRLVDLAPFYDLSRPGRYTVSAGVRIPQWNEQFVSPPRHLEIVQGTKIWERDVGIPTAGGAPELRRYVLQQANYLKRLVLYLRVTDADERRVVRVFPLGPLVSFNRPEAQVDGASRLHVLFQTGARSFSYNVVSPEGEVLVRQTHDYAQTRPVLRSREEGRIVVVGGLRRMTDTDLPRPTTESSEAAPPKS